MQMMRRLFFHFVLVLFMGAAGVLVMGSGEALAQDAEPNVRSNYCFSPGSPPIGARDAGNIGFGIDPFKITDPSPTAASIGRLALADVAIQTGAATVSIPLYEVRNRAGFTVPITLEYHSNGLKVDDISSWVGAGWTLNAGGVVTRSVVGLPDEDLGYPVMRHTYGMTGPGVNFVTQDLVVAAFRALTDFQPDYFAFSGPNLTGRFVWHDTEEFRIIPHQPVEIWRTVGTGLEWVWTIQKDQHVTYHYDFHEYIQTGPRHPYQSSWFLTEIKHPGGDITFDYVRNAPVTYQTSSGLEQRQIQGSAACQNLSGDSQSMSSAISDDVVLWKIESDDVRVEFYSSQRAYAIDVFNGQALSGRPAKLDSIRVFARDSGALMRSFTFEYVYTHASSGMWVSNRMFLDRVTETGYDGDTLPPYRFGYANMGGLPRRLGAQDAWGYAGTAGLLTHVYHPTGGYEQIDYEANVYEYGPVSGVGHRYSGQTHQRTLDVSFDVNVRGEQIVRDTFVVHAGVADSTSLNYSYSIYAGEDVSRSDRYVRLVCSDVYDSGPLYDDGEATLRLPDDTQCIAYATVAAADAANPEARSHLSFHWHEWGEFEEMRTSNVEIGGGFRVWRRRSWPADGTAPIVREYLYTDEQGQTTGLGHKPQFSISFNSYCWGTVVHSHSQTTLGPEGTVQYRRVRVREGQGGVFGETDYRFYIHLNYPDVGPQTDLFPGAMTNHDWRSHPTGERYRNASGQLLREVNHTYNSLPIGSIPDMSWAVGIRTFCVVESPGSIPFEVIFPAYYNTYNVQSGRNWLIQTTETLYDTP